LENKKEKGQTNSDLTDTVHKLCNLTVMTSGSANVSGIHLKMTDSFVLISKVHGSLSLRVLSTPKSLIQAMVSVPLTDPLLSPDLLVVFP
jgi:hypothetical protein